MTHQQQQAQKAVEEITGQGWTFKVWSYTPEMTGWWVKDDGDTVHGMRRGDPKPFYQGALAVQELYLG